MEILGRLAEEKERGLFRPPLQCWISFAGASGPSRDRRLRAVSEVSALETSLETELPPTH